MGLKIHLDLGAKGVEIRGDSELVVKQLTKEYKCIKENLFMYFVKANSLLQNLKKSTNNMSLASKIKRQMIWHKLYQDTECPKKN